MLVSGFTFLRNASLLGYPFIESIKSLLLVCDEVIVAVGKSEDNTLELVRGINDLKIKIIETTWNEKMSDRGYVYAQQKMIAEFNCTGDWAFYLEGDEVIHEQDVPLIRAQMAKYLADKDVEALVFDYYHFYGTPNHVAISPRWYRKAPRIIRNTIRTYAPDGLFWVVMDKNKTGRYPKAANVGCHLYHYGHVRSVKSMDEKNKKVERYWGKTSQSFNTYGNVDPYSIAKFNGSHPEIVHSWLQNSAEQKLVFNPEYKLTSRDKKHRLMMIIGWFLGNPNWTKKHYKLIRK
ncbi:MAG: glycosyltransferase [Burkholderiales bacterium]|jgi:glycosyltransferase involved in cell wall biosynthesis|nr:glycosyltransferase [Burkholderiales bacterium]